MSHSLFNPSKACNIHRNGADDNILPNRGSGARRRSDLLRQNDVRGSGRSIRRNKGHILPSRGSDRPIHGNDAHRRSGQILRQERLFQQSDVHDSGHSSEGGYNGRILRNNLPTYVHQRPSRQSYRPA